jgi:hypothetical protein
VLVGVLNVGVEIVALGVGVLVVACVKLEYGFV